MKAYSEYKSSGIDWLGDIPSHWAVCKIKHRISMVLGKMLQSKKPQGNGYSLEKYLKSRNVSMLEISGLDNLDEMWFSDAEKAIYLLKEGDVVMNEGGDIGKVALWHPQSFSCYLQNSVHKLTPNGTVNSLFLTYYLASISFMGFFQSIVSQISIAHLTKEKLANTPLIVPSYEEQEAIARYLDEVTAKVDTLLAEKRAQVEDLRKYRTSLITETVTRGLNPDAPLRHSGIDWLGDIPKHWISTKAKYYIEIKSGDPISKDDINPKGSVPIFGGGEIIGFTTESNIPAQTIIIGRVGARCGCVRLTDIEAWATDNALVVFTSQNPRFLTRIFDAANLNRLNESNAQPLITATKIKDLGIPLPPLVEQQAIAEFLDEKTEKVDALISELEKQLEELAEYKKAVISEAVTGKVDVRDWKPQN